MATVSTRKNTLVIDFSVLPVRPSAGNIEQFLSDKLKIEMATVKNLQVHTIRNCVLIEMRSLEEAERLAASHHLKHAMVEGTKKFNVPIYVEDTATNVRIHDLPPGIPNSVIADHLKQYGSVKSVAREVWKKFFPGVPNGVRVVRIDLIKHIPSFIRIQDNLTSVSYRSQIPTCRRCQRRVHPKQKCSEVAADANESEATTTKLSCDAQPVQQTQPPTIDASSVADNPMQMDLGTEPNPKNKRERNRRRKRNVHQPITSLEVNPSPQEQENDTIERTTPTASPGELIGGDKMDVVIVDSDSDTDPAPDDIDGWILKFNKRSKRQDKMIAEILADM